MRKKSFSLLTLMAFAFYSFAVSGCTKMVRVPASELNPVLSKKVTRIKYKNGDDVAWSENGARYFPSAQAFDGIIADGSRQQVRLGDVDSVYFVTGANQPEQSTDARTFHDDISKQDRDPIKGKIRSVVTRNGSVKFKNDSGRIDRASQAVVGTTESGQVVSIPLSEVHSFQIKRDAPGLTALAVGGVIAVSAACIISASNSLDDWGEQ